MTLVVGHRADPQALILAPMPGCSPLHMGQQRAELALCDPRVRRVIVRAPNRWGKTDWLFRAGRGVVTGWYSCARWARLQGVDVRRCCRSNHDPACTICGGHSWAPTPAKFVTVSYTKEQAAEALEVFVQQHLMTLPNRRHATFREGLTSPIDWIDGSSFRARSTKQGARAAQGFAANLVAPDESTTERMYRELVMRIPADRITKLVHTYTQTEGRGDPNTPDADEGWQDRVFFSGTTLPEDLRLITGAFWENSDGPCLTCRTPRAQWDQQLRELGLARTSGFHDALKRLCRRCRTFGGEPRYDQTWIEAREAEWAPWERAMRFWGDSVFIGGHDFFTPEQQTALRALAREPTAKRGGERRWQPPLERGPEPGWPQRVVSHVYILGVDCSEGTGRDEAVIQVLDCTAGVGAAMWSDATRQPESYAEDVRGLAHDFKVRTTVVEWEKSGSVVCQLLKYDPATALYRHRRTGRSGASVRSTLFGYRPGPQSRWRLLRQLIEAVRRLFVLLPDGTTVAEPGRPLSCVSVDLETLNQLATLHEDEDGNILTKTRHDDRVIALALAWEGRLAMFGERGLAGDEAGRGDVPSPTETTSAQEMSDCLRAWAAADPDRVS